MHAVGDTEYAANQNQDSQEKKNVKEKKYGFWRFKPSVLQCCNNPKGFLVVYTLFTCTAAMMNAGVLYTNVGALEQRFQLTSSQSGVILAGYDIGFCIFSVFITYFGDKFNRARLVAGGAFLVGFSCLLYALPHFITPLYRTGGNLLSVVCNSTFEPDCSYEIDDGNYFLILFFACLIMGIGLTPAYTLGLSYIEDSVPKRTASIYLGIANAAIFLGSMIGFLSGGTFLKDYYVDFDRTTTDLTLYDPRWVGAWWFMPMIIMGLCWILVIPLFGFPKQLPGTAKIRALRVSEVHKLGTAKASESHGFINAVKAFPMTLWTLFKNPTFLFSTMGDCVGGLVLTGLSAFLTKFIENNFHMPLGNAALLSGVTIVPAAIVGSITGGIVVYAFQWTPLGMLRFTSATTVAVALISPLFLLSCDNLPVAGLTHPYENNSLSELKNLSTTCNSMCGCQEQFHVASCSSNGLGYFSPCHAGCTNVIFNNSQQVFTECGCTHSTLTIGSCASDCHSLPGFMVLLVLLIFFSFLPFTPTILTTFRAIPEHLRSFGLGVKLILVRVLGTIPGPILYGSFVDRACIQWQTRQCSGASGACLIYQSRDMAVYFVIITVICSVVSAFFYFLGAVVYAPAVTATTVNGKTKEQNLNGVEVQKEIPTAARNQGYVED